MRHKSFNIRHQFDVIMSLMQGSERFIQRLKQNNTLSGISFSWQIHLKNTRFFFLIPGGLPVVTGAFYPGSYFQSENFFCSTQLMWLRLSVQQYIHNPHAVVLFRGQATN